MTSLQYERGTAGRLRRLVGGGAFAATLLTLVAVAFVAFGPPSTPSTVDRLAALAPRGAGPDGFVPAENATATEQEIGRWFETVRLQPDTIDAYVLLGYAYLQNVREQGDPSDYRRAEAAFAEALRRQPDNVNALIGRGALKLARHDFHGALADGEGAASLSPKTARAHGVVADALTELGRYDEAIDAVQVMVDLRPDLASLSRVAYQRELHGDLEGALDAMSRALGYSRGANAENTEYIRVLIGDLHLRRNDIPAAQAAYSSSLDELPGFVWALAGKARVYAAGEEYEAAIENYQQAVAATPLPEFLIALGETQLAAGLELEARRTLELVNAMQALYEENGVNVDLELALFEANHGDPARALAMARRAYAAQPNVKAADALAWALYRAGQAGEASRYADEALRLGSKEPVSHFHAGMIAMEVGDRGAARTHLSIALDAPAAMSPLDAITARTALAGLSD
jgi:tetratricopeptide (TPR) repeat protein